MSGWEIGNENWAKLEEVMHLGYIFLRRMHTPQQKLDFKMNIPRFYVGIIYVHYLVAFFYTKKRLATGTWSIDLMI